MLLTRVFWRIVGAGIGNTGSHGNTAQPRVLCIGTKVDLVTMPYSYTAWSKDLLCEYPQDGARFVKSTLNLTELEGAIYDAVFCSQLLKNHSLYDGGLILHGIRHLLKPGGFLHLKLPDVLVLMQQLVKNGHDLEDVAYISGLGPITYHDVLWGLGTEVAAHGSAKRGHKAGYSRKMLERLLRDNGFKDLRHIAAVGSSEVEVIAAADHLHESYCTMLGLKSSLT